MLAPQRPRNRVQQLQSWRCFLRRFLFLTPFVALAHPTGAEESPAERTLAAKGLQKKGSFYVLPGEVELSQKLQSVAGIEEKLARNLRALGELDAAAEAREQEIRQYELELRSLNEQLSQVAEDEVLENNRLVGRIGDLRLRIKLLEEQSGGQAELILASVAESRHEFLDTLATLGRLRQDTESRYSTLRADQEVCDAVTKLNQDRKRDIKLGPRPIFTKNLAEIDRIATRVKSEAIALREKGNVFELDARLNGQTVEVMILDSGASTITLPAALAKRIGLQPGDEDRVVQCKLADGRAVEAKLCYLASIEVGSFKLENVRCLVMPPEHDQAPALLGGSFLNHFEYKVDPLAKKLMLTRVEK